MLTMREAQALNVAIDLAQNDTRYRKICNRNNLFQSNLKRGVADSVYVPYYGGIGGAETVGIKRWAVLGNQPIDRDHPAKFDALDEGATTDDLLSLALEGAALDDIRCRGVPPRVVFEGEDGQMYTGNYHYVVEPLDEEAAKGYRAEPARASNDDPSDIDVMVDELRDLGYDIHADEAGDSIILSTRTGGSPNWAPPMSVHKARDWLRGFLAASRVTTVPTKRKKGEL